MQVHRTSDSQITTISSNSAPLHAQTDKNQNRTRHATRDATGELCNSPAVTRARDVGEGIAGINAPKKSYQKAEIVAIG